MQEKGTMNYLNNKVQSNVKTQEKRNQQELEPGLTKKDRGERTVNEKLLKAVNFERRALRCLDSKYEIPGNLRKLSLEAAGEKESRERW